jgi:antitoxin (DNA-binding transcriptional repressor) of toxin-antitoxin stability system
MKTATVRQLRTSFPQIESWLAAGETISLLKRRKVVGQIIPPQREKKPDFVKRFTLPKNYRQPKPGRTLRDVLDEDRGP